MKRKTRIIISLTITLAIITIAFINFAIKISSISLPPDFIELNTELILDTCSVFENIYGIPHIIAKNELDAFFMMGYMHARDRLWQMDFMRRNALGKLSEIFGKQTIMTDKYLRCFQIGKQSFEIFNRIDKNIKDILIAYSNGVNFFIEENKNRMPFEFALLDYLPEKWKPTDCIAINKFIALKLSPGFVTDLSLGEIADKVGGNKILELMPQYPINAPCILDDRIYSSFIQTKVIDTNKITYRLDIFDDFYKNESHKQLLFTMKSIHNKSNACGSNSWARKKSDSSRAGAVLANDPHLELSIPSFWYQIHITCPSINAIGFSIPGIPAISIGRNDYIAWGNAQSLIDDCDLFFEKVSSDSNHYEYVDGKQVKFKKIPDTIRIRNSDDYLYNIILTNRSAVISLNSSIQYFDTRYRNFDLSSKYYLTFLWTGNYYSDEIGSCYKVVKAKNWQQFKQALELWGSPSSIFTYADINGNIGIIPAGYFPLRNKECMPFIPNPGWQAIYSWNGYQQSSLIGELYNPEKKFVTAANHKISRNSQFVVPQYFSSPSRAIRLDTLLKQYYEYTYKDAQVMMMDANSPFAYKVLANVIPILDSMSRYLTPNQFQAKELLKNWDRFYATQSNQAAIFSELVIFLIKNIFIDELGDNVYNQYSYLAELGINKLYELIDIDTLTIWDDKRTQNIETKKDIVYLSFVDAINRLSIIFKNENPNEWYYGILNVLEIEHILSRNIFLKSVLSFKPTELRSASTTINYSEKGYDNKIKYGVSARFIADMEDTTVFMVVPGGNSGQPFSPNYSNQFPLWFTGNNISVSASRKVGLKFKQTTLFFPLNK